MVLRELGARLVKRIRCARTLNVPERGNAREDNARDAQNIFRIFEIHRLPFSFTGR